MKNKKKIQLAILSALSFGTLVASTPRALAADVAIQGGETVVESITAGQNETVTVEVIENSTWNGNATIQEGGQVGIQITDSNWNGNLIGENAGTSSGYSDISLENSIWNGNINLEVNQGLSVQAIDSLIKGDVNLNDTYGYFRLDQSSFTGNVSLDGANQSSSFDGQLENGSTWSGNVTMISGENGGSTSIMVNDHSQWNGDVNSSTTEIDGATGYTSVRVYGDSVWNGKADINNGSYYGTVEANSVWNGDLNLTATHTDYANSYISVYENSTWNGQVSSIFSGPETGSVNVNISSSNWDGDISTIQSGETLHTQTAIQIYGTSNWNGNLKIDNNSIGSEYPSNGSVQVYGSSNWIGNVMLEGYLNYNGNVGYNSTWIGDLDASKMVLDEDCSCGNFIAIQENSLWKGQLISNEGIFNAAIDTGSEWKMTGDSKVKDFYLYDSQISFSNPDQFSTLNIDGNLDGHDSRFNMRVDVAGNQGDLIDIKGNVTGQYELQVQNQGSAWVNPENELTVVQTGTSADDAFSLVNQVEVGGFEYGLKQVGTNWNLYSTGRSSSTASASLNAFAGSYLLNYAETQTLFQRMGELHNSNVDRKGDLWARVYGGEFESSGNSFLHGFSMDYSGIQVGADRKINLPEGKGNLYLGGMLGYTSGSLDHGVGNGSIKSTTAGIYGTYLSPNQFHADLVLKYGNLKNDFSVLDSSRTLIKGETMNTDGFSASLEVGKKFYVNESKNGKFYVEPQAQLSVSHYSGGSFTASNELNIDVNGFNSVLGRVGTQVGFEKESGDRKYNIHLKASRVHQFDGDVGIRFNGVGVDQSFGDSWWTYGIGADVKVGKKHNLYVSAEQATGGQFRQPWTITGGYRFSW